MVRSVTGLLGEGLLLTGRTACSAISGRCGSSTFVKLTTRSRRYFSWHAIKMMSFQSGRRSVFRRKTK